MSDIAEVSTKGPTQIKLHLFIIILYIRVVME